MATNPIHAPRRHRLRGAARRGAALFIVMLFVFAVGALAISATFLTSNSTLIVRSYGKEADLRYAAEAALAIGKSRVNFDASALPDTGFVTLLQHAAVRGADNFLIPGLQVNLYLGPSGSTSGQFGRFASVVAEARDAQGNGFVRRLELSQESFAKFAYWTNDESNSGSTIYFGNGDQLWGPVWSNDQISIASSGATFHDEVGTASTISGAGYGTFTKGYKTRQKPIALPSLTSLAKLAGYATPANFAFAPPNAGDESLVRMRLEFVAVDLNGDGDSTDTDEGFFRVYQATASGIGWLRADWPGSGPAPSQVQNCGDWHRLKPGSSELAFFPASIHATRWFRQHLVNTGEMVNSSARAESSATVATIMQHANSRCYLGGDPHLAAAARGAYTGADTLLKQVPGTDSTFTPVDKYGQWLLYTNTPDPRLVNVARRADANYLFPIHRSINPASKGVIYANGTVGVSGVLRGRLTLYATGTVVVLDDMRYSSNPASGACQDILGIIAANDIVVADNSVNTPQTVKSTYPKDTRNLDDSKDLHLHGVLMALSTSFRVEDYNAGPSNENDCEGSDNGRGCLYLVGGVIQKNRGPVGLLSGEGFVKRYSYDRCAVVNPPPYFPTTGRFNDNRYFELDPVNFDVVSLFRSMTPN